MIKPKDKFPEVHYFQAWEFESPDLPGSGNLMNRQFILKLNKARAIADIAFDINSGYRTVAHNKKVKGKIYSSHLKGLASDIKAKSSTIRHIIISSLILAGFNRIGIHKTFIHVDMDDKKIRNVIWLYKKE